MIKLEFEYPQYIYENFRILYARVLDLEHVIYTSMFYTITNDLTNINFTINLKFYII
jgi:hypothetical protein